MTFDEKVRLYLERSAQCEDGDTEELGKEIVHQLALDHAARKKSEYEHVVFRESGTHTPNTDQGIKGPWSLVRVNGARVFQNPKGTIVPFHAVKMAS